MLPGALRRRGARAPGQRSRNFEKRRGTGEKGHKRMAQAGCVFDVAVPDEPRTPEQILCREPGQPPPQAPEAAGTWYTAGIAGGAAETIAALFDQAGRRDPARARTWIALADGDNHQIRLIQDQAAARGVTVTILIDFVHVQEYLWKAAWCFHRPRDPAIEAWVTAQELDILHGRVQRRDHPDRGTWPPRTRPGPAASTARSSPKPCPTCRTSSPTWTTPAPWQQAGRSPPASSKAPAAT